QAKGLAGRVVGDTWIVEPLDHAANVLKNGPPTLRVVTLQGEVLSASHLLHVGSMPHETSIISRKSELKQLKNEIHQLQKNIEVITQRQQILTEKQEHRVTELDQLEVELKQLSHAVTEQSTQLSGQAREVQRLEKEFSEQNAVLDKLNQREQSIAQEIAFVQESSSAAETALTEMR